MYFYFYLNMIICSSSAQVYLPGISLSWRLSRNSTRLLEVFLRPGVFRIPTQGECLAPADPSLAPPAFPITVDEAAFSSDVDTEVPSVFAVPGWFCASLNPLRPAICLDSDCLGSCVELWEE